MSTEATNREAAVALAEALGNLPLALEQAAAYTAQTGLSLAEYLALFRERAARYTPPASPSAVYPEALVVTFEIAFARLREDSPAAADLLNLCAFLAPDDVPLEIFKEAAAKTGAEATPAEALASAAATLQTYALAKVRGGSFLSMHRLTQAVARDRLGDEESKSWAGAAVTLMATAFPFSPEDTRTWPPSARLLQHALTAAEYARVKGVAGDLTALLLNSAGMYLHKNAKLAEARAAFEKSIELSEKLLGPANPGLAVLLDNVSQTLMLQGNLDEAADYLKRALAIDEAALGPEHANVAVRLNNIGEVLRARGAYDDARSHYERAVTIFEAAFGHTHGYLASAINNIGLILYAQGDPKGACAYYERALKIYEEVYGDNHPNVAIALTNLGAALLSLDEVAAARQHLERALSIFRNHFGDNHPWTLNVNLRLEELDKLAAGGPSPEEAATAAAEDETSEAGQ